VAAFYILLPCAHSSSLSQWSSGFALADKAGDSNALFMLICAEIAIKPISNLGFEHKPTPPRRNVMLLGFLTACGR
jgi:hypothetical protein